MQNPFTTTYSKIPASSYIPTEQVEEILQNFTYEQPSESVYKITGVRGSGKTVLLASVEQKMESEEMKQNGWYVYRLSPARDMLRQLLSFLARDGIIKEKKVPVAGSASHPLRMISIRTWAWNWMLR